MAATLAAGGACAVAAAARGGDREWSGARRAGGLAARRAELPSGGSCDKQAMLRQRRAAPRAAAAARAPLVQVRASLRQCGIAPHGATRREGRRDALTTGAGVATRASRALLLALCVMPFFNLAPPSV